MKVFSLQLLYFMDKPFPFTLDVRSRVGMVRVVFEYFRVHHILSLGDP